MTSVAASGSRPPSRDPVAGEPSPGTGASARAFWDSSDALLGILGPDLLVEDVNPAWQRVLGWSTSELAGTSLLPLVHEEDRQRVEDVLAARSLTETMHPVEARVRTARGDYVLLSLGGTLSEGTWYVAGSTLTSTRDVERGLRETADFWQQTLDAMEGQVVVVDESGMIVAVNESWRETARAHGRRAHHLGEDYLAVCDLAQDDPWAVRTAEGVRILMAGERDHFTLDYPCDDGWYTLQAARFRGDGPPRVVLSHIRLTPSRRAVDAAWTRAALLDELDAAVVALDTGNRVTHWNKGAERLFAVPRDEALGRPAGELVVRVDPDARSPSDRTGGALTDVTGPRALLRRRDGSLVTAQVRNSPLLDRDGRVQGTISICLDASSEIQAEREVAHARNHLRAVTDSMGEGLFALDGEGRVTVMNQAAEGLLGWTFEDIGGQRIHDVIHHHDPDGRPFSEGTCPLQQVHRDGETLRLAADVFLRRDGLGLPVTFTAAPLETETGATGCVVVFMDATEVHAEQQKLAEELTGLAWVQRLRRVLDEERFELYAQPILHLGSRTVTQHELLLRVRGADGTVEGPMDYLRTAEEHGLIGEIDRWVIQRSLELAAGGMHVELNISAASLGDVALLADIEHWLHDSRADPSLVVFEITETALIRDQHAGRIFVQRLHELGFRVALDDFGTGYGGFTYLKQLPVHFLKIDIEFVRDLCENTASRHVVQAVVNLARGFGLQTVAEGVEDQQTLDLLRELDVDFAQGYHIGRPAPVS